MTKIDYTEKQITKEKILGVITASSGIKELEIAEATGLNKRTVNNYLREMQDDYLILKIGLKWYLAIDEAFSKINLHLSEASIVEKMVGDQIGLKQALDYFNLTQAEYKAATTYMEIMDTVDTVLIDKYWVICFENLNLALLEERHTGKTRGSVLDRIARQILPNALSHGVENAIRSYLRFRLEISSD